MEISSNTNLRIRYLMTTLSPKRTINQLYSQCHHQKPDLNNPKTLDEKIQWMKLHYYNRNDLVKQCADKWRVRNYVKDNGLEKLLTRIIAIYHDPDEINWDSLPEKFMLKWNFGEGGNVVCTDKKNLNIEATLNDLKLYQELKYHLLAAEMQYDVDEKVLLCEEFIEPEQGISPREYQFYCFNGEAKYVMCNIRREEGQKPAFYFFDRNWQLQRFNRQGQEAPENFTVPKPEGIDQLFDYAETLAKPFPFVRADFYLEHGHGWFSGLTFSPSGGFDHDRLPESDLLFGEMVKLPQI